MTDVALAAVLVRALGRPPCWLLSAHDTQPESKQQWPLWPQITPFPVSPSLSQEICLLIPRAARLRGNEDCYLRWRQSQTPWGHGDRGSRWGRGQRQLSLSPVQMHEISDWPTSALWHCRRLSTCKHAACGLNFLPVCLISPCRSNEQPGLSAIASGLTGWLAGSGSEGEPGRRGTLTGIGGDTSLGGDQCKHLESVRLYWT